MIVLMLGCARAPDPSLLDPESCRGCHPAHVEQWEGSMHAYAAEDPVFRAMNERGQREADLGDFCVSCHAPVAVALGETTDGTNLDEVPDHLRGVTCVACHGIDGVHQLNNAGFSWTFDGRMRGALASPVENPVHDSTYSRLHDRNDNLSSDLCGSCHDVVTPGGVELERTYLQWSETVFASAGPERQSCGHCHMRGRDGRATETIETPERRLHDHSMVAIDVALTDFPHKDAQRALIEQELAATVLAGLCVVPAAGGVELVVQLENVSAGHAFPSGASHDRRVWVDVTPSLEGEPLMSSPWRIDLNDRALDADGELAHLFWDVSFIEEFALPAAGPEGTAHVKEWRQTLLGPTPDTVELVLYVTPMAAELLNDLSASGDLDLAALDPVPTFDPVRLEWAGSIGTCVVSG